MGCVEGREGVGFELLGRWTRLHCGDGALLVGAVCGGALGSAQRAERAT